MKKVLDAKDIINERDASIMLNVSLSTLRRWRSEGKRPNYIRLGRSIRYSITELSSVLEEKSTKWTL